MQVPLYYILLESCHFPLSNVIINVSTFPHIQSLYPLQAHIFLFNLSYLFPIQILTLKMPLAIESILYLDRLSMKFQTLKLMIYKISNELFAIFLSQHCIFAITQWFSYQYIIYYIPLESSDLPLSNGTVIKVKFSHIFYLLNLLFKYLIYL